MHELVTINTELFLQLLSVLQWKKDIPISLRWTKDHANNMHDGTQDQIEGPPSTTTMENISAPTTSDRLKKTPVTINEKNFFLDNGLPKTRTLNTSVIHGKGQTSN